MLGLSVMRVIQTTLGQFPPCDPAGGTSHARLWTSRGKEGQTGRGSWREEGVEPAEVTRLRTFQLEENVAD